ncbi:MAG: hypothetical protein KBE24_07245 [Fusobacteriaceae bacterium]|jgi:hypothetical protein|nr:hypothetical protein [Fusobacteriaceae bacterium]
MNSYIKTKEIKKELQEKAYDKIKLRLKESNISEREMARQLYYDRGLVNRVFCKIYLEECLEQENESLKILNKIPLTLFRALLKLKREEKEKIVYFFREFSEIIESLNVSDLKKFKNLIDLYLAREIKNKEDYLSMASLKNSLKKENKELKRQLKEAKDLIKNLKKENDELRKNKLFY